MIKQLLIFWLIGSFAYANAQPNAVFKGNIGDKKATLYIYNSDNPKRCTGYYYLGNGEDRFFILYGDIQSQGDSIVQELSAQDGYTYRDDHARLKGSLKNGVMQGIWTSADGKKTTSYKLTRQSKNKDLAQQRIYQHFKQRFCNVSLPITKKTKGCNIPQKQMSRQVFNLFFAQFHIYLRRKGQHLHKRECQAYARFGPGQGNFTPLYQVSHPYQDRFDILVMNISQKDGDSRFSPMSSNTFVITYDKYGNYISSVLLSYLTIAEVIPSWKDTQKKGYKLKHEESSFVGTFNRRLQIISRDNPFATIDYNNKLHVYQVLPNGYIVLL